MALWALGAAVALAERLPAQLGEATDDPYTKGDADAMFAAGYERFAPFEFVGGETTKSLDKLLGVRVLWVETAHFRIGTSLPELALDPSQRGQITAELRRLGKRLPKVPKVARRLDPWLRLHLTAQRLEELYADVQAKLGVSRSDFPPSPAEAALRERYMGDGPYLGMADKYTVLLLARASSYGRFFRRLTKTQPEIPMRHHFRDTGSLFFGTALELDPPSIQSDVRLHGQLVFNVVTNLLAGYRGYNHGVPLWFADGVAQWFARRVAPEHPVFNVEADGKAERRTQTRWEPIVRAYCKAEQFTPLEELARRQRFDDWKWIDHVMAWSRVDFMLRRDEGALGAFATVFKDPFDGAVPTPGHLRERQDHALREAVGLDTASFDEDWCAWVLATYPRR